MPFHKDISISVEKHQHTPATCNKKNTVSRKKKKKRLKLLSLVPPAEPVFLDHLAERCKMYRDVGGLFSYSL